MASLFKQGRVGNARNRHRPIEIGENGISHIKTFQCRRASVKPQFAQKPLNQNVERPKSNVEQCVNNFPLHVLDSDLSSQTLREVFSFE
jgi:hypothetical protein